MEDRAREDGIRSQGALPQGHGPEGGPGGRAGARRTHGSVTRRDLVARGGLFDGAALSRVGRQRPDNQDRFTLRVLPGAESGTLGYFGVADGVGGAPAGKMASAIAIATASRNLDEILPGFSGPAGEEVDAEGRLRRVVDDCQSAIERYVAGHPDAWGMATTLTLGCVVWPKLVLAHVGDSRAYLLRRSRLRRLTRDHTCAQDLIDRGLFEAGSAGAERWKNVILNLVGGRSPEVRPDVTTIGLRQGDVLLLCTDGLSDILDDSRIAEILRTPGPAEGICRRLVAEADGRDDVTVVAIRFARRGLLRRIRGWFRPS